MYTLWMQQCLALHRLGTALWLSPYAVWLPRTPDSSPSGEPWLDCVRSAELARRPRVVNCAAGYYSCCNLNLAHMRPLNDACWVRSSLGA